MAEVYRCDDNELDRRRLAMALDSISRQNFASLQIREFESGEDFLRAWEAAQVKPALIFLDIYMDGIDGMQLARSLRQSGSRVPLIFTTSSEYHGVEAFSVFAGGYLRKPYTREQLNEAVRPYMAHMMSEIRSLTVTVRRVERSFPLREILYLEAEGHSTHIHTRTETLKCSTDMSDFREKLAGEPAFMECGKSYLINLFCVRRWELNTIVMQDGSEVYMPQRLAAGLKKYMEGFLHGYDVPV